MEGKGDFKHHFTPASSLVINCDSQDEIDYYWSSLSSDPNSEQCGWLKDKYGVSWQVVPSVLSSMVSDPDKSKSDKVMKAIMQMKKIDLKN